MGLEDWARRFFGVGESKAVVESKEREETEEMDVDVDARA